MSTYCKGLTKHTYVVIVTVLPMEDIGVIHVWLPSSIILSLAKCCNRVVKLVQHVHNNVATCCFEMFGAFGCALTSLWRCSRTRASSAQNTGMVLFRVSHDHTSRIPNSVEAIFPRRFYVHVRLLHFFRFFLFYIRKPLASRTYNLIVAISNQFLFSLKTDE